MQNNPKISIIIPVYNVEQHLKKCIESVLNQSYTNLEIILIDDGSEDCSSRICDEYLTKDDRILCIHQKNRGVSYARNVGIELATGEYVHFLDGDDYMDSYAYEYLIKTMQSKRCDAIGFEYYLTYLDGEDIPHKVLPERYGIRDRKGSIYEHLFGSSNFLCTKLLPSYVVKKYRLRTDIYRDEDTLYCMEVLQSINRVYFSDKPLLHYVQSASSATRGSFRVNQLTAIKAIPIMERFLSNNYPEWINTWRIKYMHLMTTLYRDMYIDKGYYKKEKRRVYKAFSYLYKKVGLFNINSHSARVKFLIFKYSPTLYCRISTLRS